MNKKKEFNKFHLIVYAWFIKALPQVLHRKFSLSSFCVKEKFFLANKLEKKFKEKNWM